MTLLMAARQFAFVAVCVGTNEFRQLSLNSVCECCTRSICFVCVDRSSKGINIVVFLFSLTSEMRAAVIIVLVACFGTRYGGGGGGYPGENPWCFFLIVFLWAPNVLCGLLEFHFIFKTLACTLLHPLPLHPPPPPPLILLAHLRIPF